MKNLAIFTIPKKMMDFFEVTGGLRLDSVLKGTPPRKGGPTTRRELKKSPSSLDQEGLCKGLTKSMEIQQFPLWDKIKNKRIPLSFDLEITARCNLNCRHCYINLPAGDRDARNRELTAAEIMGIARQAVDMGALWCLITGGEPLLRPDFAEIYVGLKRLGLLVSVFTNATLINQEHVRLFKKYPPRDIEVTVYGITKKTWEAVTRRPDSFDSFMNGLDSLAAEGVPIRLKTMAIQSNLHEQNEIATFCRARTKDFFRFDPQLHLRFDGNPVRNDEIRAERLTPEQIVTLEAADEQRMNAMCKERDTLINEEFTHYNDDRLFHCGTGNSSFNVSYDGRFRLCSPLWAEGTTYDLKTGTLAEAWNDFVPMVRDLRSRRKEFLETCSTCALLNLCMWCPAHAHLETGELDGSTFYFCQVAHKRAENLKKQR
ncbi:MAG: radical SAM protein [Desulfatiglandales bacterium]